MSRVLHRLAEAFSLKTRSGYAVPQKTLVYETPRVPLADVISLYERDPTCKASVDLHKQIRKLALLNDLRIYALANAIIEETLKDPEKTNALIKTLKL